MKKVGIFGGSFNPIHTGHIALAKSLCEKAGLDGVVHGFAHEPIQEDRYRLARRPAAPGNGRKSAGTSHN